jgi:hypothetical protein
MSRASLRKLPFAAAVLGLAALARTQSAAVPAAPIAARAVALAIANAAFPVSVTEVSGHVQFLASPELAGRGSGSREGAIASTYIAAEFAKLGLAPAGEEGTFWQPFDRIQVTLGEVKADGAATQVQQTLRCWRRSSRTCSQPTRFRCSAPPWPPATPVDKKKWVCEEQMAAKKELETLIDALDKLTNDEAALLEDALERARAQVARRNREKEQF